MRTPAEDEEVTRLLREYYRCQQTQKFIDDEMQGIEEELTELGIDIEMVRP